MLIRLALDYLAVRSVGGAGGVSVRSKVAVTDLTASMVTVQGPVPVQSPLQPVKVDPAAEVAVRVTEVPPV